MHGFDWDEPFDLQATSKEGKDNVSFYHNTSTFHKTSSRPRTLLSTKGERPYVCSPHEESQNREVVWLEKCVIERKAQHILEHLPSVKNSCLPPGKLSMWQEQNGSQKQLKIFKRFSWYRKYLQGEARKMRTPLQPSGPEQSQSDLKGNRFQMLHFIFTWEVRRRGRGWRLGGCDLCFHLLCVTWNFLFVILSSVVQNQYATWAPTVSFPNKDHSRKQCLCNVKGIRKIRWRISRCLDWENIATLDLGVYVDRNMRTDQEPLQNVARQQ